MQYTLILENIILESKKLCHDFYFNANCLYKIFITNEYDKFLIMYSFPITNKSHELVDSVKKNLIMWMKIIC